MLKKILNAVLSILSALKNAGLFKKGKSIDDLTPKKRYRPYK